MFNNNIKYNNYKYKMNRTESQKLFKEMFSNNIKLDIIINYILLLHHGRLCFQIEKNNINSLNELEYLKQLNIKYNSEFIIYNDNTEENNAINTTDILNNYYICTLKNHYSKLDIDKIKQNNTYYIGSILQIEHPLEKFRSLYLFKNDNAYFQVKITGKFNNNTWDINDVAALYKFDKSITATDNIMVFMTDTCNNPNTFILLTKFQQIFFDLQIPVKFHMEIDARPKQWIEIKQNNFLPLYNEIIN